MSVTKICVICGTEFQAIPSWDQIRDTCSKECRYKLVSEQLSQKETRRCKQCGKPFVVVPSYKQTLCSQSCRTQYMSDLFKGSRNPWWKETKTLRPSTKRSLRKRIKSRDKVCQDCGTQFHLQVHHMDSNPSNNRESNLVLLCKYCHAKQHELTGESEVAHLILSNRTYNHLEPQTCPICQAVFQPKRRKQITCSLRCGRIQSGRTRSDSTTR